MTELERALVALGRELDLPLTPDLAPHVRARVRRSWIRRPALIAALVVLAVALGIAFAVPPARSAILRFFHLGAATVEKVETLPAARERPLAAGLGPVRTRTEAERIAGFGVQLPPLKGEPPQRFYAQPGLIAVFFSGGEPVLLTELSGDQVGVAKKYATGATQLAPIDVEGHFGIRLSGGPHVLTYERPNGDLVEQATRLAGDVLLWHAGNLTYRLEGGLAKTAALRLARLVTP